MAIKNTGSKETLLPLDPDKADKTGFLHGTRAIITKFRAILYNYADKDGVGKTNDDGSEVQAPGFMVDFQTKGGEAKTYNQFYSNGGADQRVPNKKGTGFVAAPGSKATSAVVEGSNAYLLLASLKSCGWPTSQLTGDCSVFEGATVDLIAQPVGDSKRAKAEGQRQRTIAVIGKIVKYPEGVSEEGDEPEEDEDEDETPAPKKSKAAPVEDDDDEDEDEADTEDDADDDADDDDDDEAPAKPTKKAAKPADDDDDEDTDDDAEGDDPLVTSAQEYVAAVLTSKKFRGKPVDLTTLSKEVLLLARTDKSKQKIIALVQDPAFHKTAPWTYDKKSKSISADVE